MSLILLLKSNKKPTIKAEIKNIITPTINFINYFPSNPFGESTKNNTPINAATTTDEKIAIVDMAAGMAWTKIHHTRPIPNAITKLSLIMSYVFKKVYFCDKPAVSISLSLSA